MRLLRKKTEREIIEALSRAMENARGAMELVKVKDREIERLTRELQLQRVLHDWPSHSSLVH